MNNDNELVNNHNEWSDDSDVSDTNYEYNYDYDYFNKQCYYKIYNEAMYIHTTEYTKKYNIFLIVENKFKDEISSYREEYIKTISMCYSIQNKKNVIQIGDKIQEIFPYNILGNYDLYLTLIFIYYSLLAEPGEEIFEGWFLNRHSLNVMMVTKLYLILTTGDLFEKNGNNISKHVRRFFLGFQ